MLRTEYLKFRNWLNTAKRNQNVFDIQSKSLSSIIHMHVSLSLSYLGYKIYIFMSIDTCMYISTVSWALDM